MDFFLGKQARSVVLSLSFATILAGEAGAVDFAGAKSYPVGAAPSAAVVADFNGDGKLDLAVLCGATVSILLGNGDGTFQGAVSFPTGSTASVIAVGDFNGDGKADLATLQPGDSSTSIAGSVSILFGNGDGSFQAPKVTTLGVSVATMVVGDFSGDKRADLVVAVNGTGAGTVSLQILTGKGDGTFQTPKAIPSDIQNVNFTAADFNKDGKLDLAIAVSGGVQVLGGRGDGTFLPGGIASVSDGFTAGFVETADLNGDGNTDLIVSSGKTWCGGFNCTSQFNTSIFLGMGDGTFGAEQIFAQGVSSRDEIGIGASDTVGDILTGDFNGDGKADVVDRRSEKHSFPGAPVTVTLQIRLGKGDGTLAAPITLADPGMVAAAADLNGDKLPDLVVLDSSHNSVLVVLNSSASSGADLGIISSAVSSSELFNSSSSQTVGQGINLTYSADVLNEGPQDATNVTFTDTLPNGTAFVSAQSSRGACTQSHLTVTCVIGPLASAMETQITIVVTPTSTGTISNTMVVSAAESDPILTNNQATQTTTVVPVYTLTVNKSGNGNGIVSSNYKFSTGAGGSINCGSTCSATFLSGTQVIVGFQSDGKNFLSGWGGACSGTGGCSLTMDSNKTITANIVAASTLTVNMTGTGTGSVTDSQGGANIICSNAQGSCLAYYFPGTSVSLIATPSGNSTFGGWSGACTGTDPNSCSVTLNTSQTVTATFGPPPDFSLTAAAGNLTLQQGQTVTDVVSVVARGGFSSAIQLSCNVAGPAPMPACSLSPAVIPAGANSPTSTLSITMPARSASLTWPGAEWPSPSPYGLGIALALVLLLPFGIKSAVRREARLRCACLAFVVILLWLGGCGGGSSSKRKPQAFVITVAANSGALQHALTVSVTEPE